MFGLNDKKKHAKKKKFRLWDWFILIGDFFLLSMMVFLACRDFAFGYIVWMIIVICLIVIQIRKYQRLRRESKKETIPEPPEWGSL
jgi:L-asparagine transporter-like permease